jgi:O-antigen ligase
LQDFEIRLTLLFCLAIWFGVFCFLIFKLDDLLLIGLWLFVVAACFTGFTLKIKIDCIVFLTGLTMGKLPLLLLLSKPAIKIPSVIFCFLAGLIVLLAFGSWWHLDVAHKFYPGTRWTGLWDNPNDYGILMSIGVLLAVGLLAGENWRPAGGGWLAIILLIAAGMMAVGLFFSYSRGAWLGLMVGLLYLARIYGRLKWWNFFLAILIPTAMIWHFWNVALDSSAWQTKRMDFSRPSAQHRIAAWKAGFEIMRDHPFGVGWNKTVDVYQKNYSPPQNGAGAITTNDYLMLGTQLGIPALILFLTYVALCFKKNGPLPNQTVSPPAGRTGGIACRAAVIAMLVEFWFDGGLFKLATVSIFWILLELGAV